MKKWFQVAIGCAISAVFLWLAFRAIDLKALGQAFSAVNWFFVIPFLAVTMAQMWVRTLRWRILLLAEMDIPSVRLFGPLMIGFGLNNIFPARAGEFARPLALQKTEGVPFAAGLSTVVVERILDGMVLLAMFAALPLLVEFREGVEQTWDSRSVWTGAQLNLALGLGAFGVAAAVAAAAWTLRTRAWFAPFRMMAWGAAALAAVAGVVVFVVSPYDPSSSRTFGGVFVLNKATFDGLVQKLSIMVGVLLAGVVFVLSPWGQRLVPWMLEKFPFIPSFLRKLALSIFMRVTGGFAVLRDPRMLAIAVGYSLVVWLLGAWSYQIMSLGFPGVSLTIAGGIAFLAITSLGVLLPSAPGFWGLFEVAGVVALLVIGVVDNTPQGISLALGYTILCHFFQWMPIGAIGLGYAMHLHLKPAAVEEAMEAAESDASAKR